MTAKRPGPFELRIPFFIPVWRRVVFVALLAAWSFAEIAFANYFWALMAGGIALYAIYSLFLTFHLDDGPGGQS